MENPFEKLETRLSNIESLLLDIKHKPEHSLNSDQDKPMTAKEAADFLSVSLSYIRNHTSDGTIPYSKPKGRVYYYRNELTDWVKAGYKLTKEQQAERAMERLRNVNKK